MNTKKWTVLLIGILLALFVGTPVPTVLSTDTDTFTVTMSGAYLEVNIINATWAIGNVNMSGITPHYWTNETSETQDAETYNCTAGVNIDFEMVISSDAADWKTVWAENWTTGSNQYKMNVSNDSWTSEDALNLTTYANVSVDFDPSVNVSFDLRFDTPTGTTTGVQQTITLTGKVTVH